MQVTLHRFVLAELNTHRVCSRNSASSRAIPAAKTRDAVLASPAWPVEWGANQKGMQAAQELWGWRRTLAKALWSSHRLMSAAHHWALEKVGLHKQLTNRLIEPHMWHTVIVSSTEWNNFFEQRCSPLAQPEIREAAMAMQRALHDSRPKQLRYGEWHLPYVDVAYERDERGEWERVASSVARCARVSYLTHEKKLDVYADYELYLKLVEAKPPHWSPLEHVARPAYETMDTNLKGNFDGWQQLRHSPGSRDLCTQTIQRRLGGTF